MKPSQLVNALRIPGYALRAPVAWVTVPGIS